MVCQIPISKGYRGYRTLLHELSARLLDVNITQSTSQRISIAYLCAAELTIRLPFSATKPSNYINLLALLSPYRQSRVLRSSASDLLSTQSSSTNTALRRFSCCAPTVWNSLPSFVCTADSLTSFSHSSRLTCLQVICVCASDTHIRFFKHYKIATYELTLLTYLLYGSCFCQLVLSQPFLKVTIIVTAYYTYFNFSYSYYYS